MAPTSRLVFEEIDNFLNYLIETGLAIDATPVADFGGRITWRGTEPNEGFLPERRFPTCNSYKVWVHARAYSAVLFDGSLLQLTYDFAGRSVVAHRLAWVPCPFHLDAQLLRTEPLLDIIELYGAVDEVVLFSTVRFDFDILAARPGHPASHFTVNSADCRIACAAPMRLGRFVGFVFGNFYPEIYEADAYLQGISNAPLGPHTLTADEMNGIHISWPR
jgi:hypothetical protein